MSISKVKKQFEEFTSYLGRDTDGLKRLKSLKDSVNELRKRLASIESKEAEASALKESLLKRAIAAESEAENAQGEVLRLQQVVRGLELRIAAISVEAQASTPDVNDAGAGRHNDMKHVIKRLMCRLKNCPEPKRTHALSGLSYDRESIAIGWSHDAIWTLGAAMALLVKLDGVVVLESQSLMRDREEYDESSVLLFTKWYRKNNIGVTVDEVRECESVAGIRIAGKIIEARPGADLVKRRPVIAQET